MIPSLRVSVWSACDLACLYCHKEGNRHPGRHLSDDEVLHLIRAAIPQGLVKVKITGGEPLLRPHLSDLLKQIVHWGLEVSLTTNGTRLALWAQEFRDIGLSKVSVSLDTLNPERFRNLCGADRLPLVVGGITAARDAGLPLELNTVLMAGVNEHEWDELIAFARKMQARIQFIELSPATQSREFYEHHHVSLDHLEQLLRTQGEMLEGVRQEGDRPRYRFNGVDVNLCRVVGKTPVPGPRRRGLRLSADGKVYGFEYQQDACLADLAAAYRAGARESELTRIWAQAGSLIHPINQKEVLFHETEFSGKRRRSYF